MPVSVLRRLPTGARLGVVFACLVLAIGLGASALHIKWHYEKRDERPGLSPDDIQGAYHGLRTRAPLVEALERNHPETQPAARRDALLDWLLGKKDANGQRPAGGNPRLSTEYDNLDLGDMAPAEIIRADCLSCHARSVAEQHPIAKTIPLDYWDDVRALATSRDVKPVDPKVLAISIHAHALSLGIIAIGVGALLCLTRWPRGLVGGLTALAGLGLLLDFVGQIGAREIAGAFWLIIVGGGVFNALTALMLVLISLDVVLPRQRDPA
ncbi:MAG: hypothetical protein SFY69_11530 [Planctomycetota bacterium]|nr:hypothetical protein [Planctomycetota bacterium]